MAIGLRGNGARPSDAGAGGRGAGAERPAGRRRAPPGEELRDARHALDPSLRRGALSPAAHRACRGARGSAAAESAARADPVEELPAARPAEEVAPDARARARSRQHERHPFGLAADLGGRPGDHCLCAGPRRHPPAERAARRALAEARRRRGAAQGLGRRRARAPARQPDGGQAPMLEKSLERLVFGLILFLTLISYDAQGQTRSLPDFKSLMKAAGPAVVNVISTRKAQTAAAGGGAATVTRREQPPRLEFFRRYMPDLPERGGAPPRAGLGSGFIISEDGYILTNAHVVAEFDDVNVRLADAKREFKAKVVGVDKRSDIALLKVEARGLPTAKLGNSTNLEPGDWVAAIGSPFGFANTTTARIGSAKGPSLPYARDVPLIPTHFACNL